MRTQRFFGATAREALARVKASLGEDAVILRNRRVDGGVEILATADTHWSRDDGGPADMSARHAPEATAPAARSVAADKEARPPAMSTVSFQRYAQERRRPLEAGAAPWPADGAMDAAGGTAPASTGRRRSCA